MDIWFSWSALNFHWFDQSFLFVSGLTFFICGLISNWDWWNVWFFCNFADACGSLYNRIFVDTNYIKLSIVLKIWNRDLNETFFVWSLVKNLKRWNAQEVLQIFNFVFTIRNNVFRSVKTLHALFCHFWFFFTAVGSHITIITTFLLNILKTWKMRHLIICSFFEIFVCSCGVPNELLFH